MVKVIHCTECYKTTEVRSDSDMDIYVEPSYCPFCGTQEENEEDYEKNYSFDDSEEW